MVLIDAMVPQLPNTIEPIVRWTTKRKADERNRRWKIAAIAANYLVVAESATGAEEGDADALIIRWVPCGRTQRGNKRERETVRERAKERETVR